jgi:hypothetical protein
MKSWGLTRQKSVDPNTLPSLSCVAGVCWSAGQGFFSYFLSVLILNRHRIEYHCCFSAVIPQNMPFFINVIAVDLYNFDVSYATEV